jgi:hypothetical protein
MTRNVNVDLHFQPKASLVLGSIQSTKLLSSDIFSVKVRKLCTLHFFQERQKNYHVGVLVHRAFYFSKNAHQNCFI